MSSADINNALQATRARLEELKSRREAREKNNPPPPPDAAAGPVRTAPTGASGGRGPAPPPPGSRVAGVDPALLAAVGVRPTVLTASVGVAGYSIAPQEKHTYDKSTQTEFGVALQGKAADMEKELRAAQESLMQREEKCKVLMEQLKIDKEKYDKLREDERLQETKELSPEEQKRILSSDGFKTFFGKATRVLERALQSNYDETTEHWGAGQVQDSSRGKGLQAMTSFQDKRVSGRAVTSIDWSHKYPELLLASYAGQTDPMSLDQHGTVFIWNTHMVNRPEYVFTCNSAVLSAQFHPTQPNLILGACQSGQVVIWDTREKTTPVNRTSLSHGHTHPVYALDLVSVVNRLHNIVSLSTDGFLCIWSDNNLHTPSREVQYGSDAKEVITTTSFAFPKNSQSLVMGSDEGSLYKAHVYDNPGIYETVQAHKAPITSVRFHPSQKNNNLAEYFLTSSYDWTVKLWSNKINRPLFTFESAKDYVFDAQWSPVHPALFAMGDGTGRLDLWNVNKDTELPTLSANVNPAAAPGDKAAISRVSWSDNGSSLAAGTSQGIVHVYNVPQEEATPSQEDGSALLDKLQKKFSE